MQIYLKKFSYPNTKLMINQMRNKMKTKKKEKKEVQDCIIKH